MSKPANQKKDESKPIKTVEFKARLAKEIVQRVEAWMTDLRKVWNMGLELLLDNQQWYWREKNDAIFEDDCYPVPWEWHGNQDRGWGLACDITAQSSRRYGKADQLYPSCDRDYRPACPIKKTPSNQPPTVVIKGKDPCMGLNTYFSAKNHPDKPWLCDIPSVFVRGMLDSLAKAWVEYRKGARKQPKFKSARNPIRSLRSKDCATSVEVKGKKIRLPKLGWLTVKTLDTRWNPDSKPKVFHLCKRPSGWYVQLTGEVPGAPVKPARRVCGLDVGLQYILVDDAGKVVEPPKYYRKAEKRLRRMQRKAARQYRMNGKSANWEKTQKLVARQHERVANQRRLFNHKISTYRVRTYAAIAVEDIKLANLVRRPKPIETEEGSGVWQKNRAANKAGLNKSFADAGLGQLLVMIETKAKAAGRQFERVAPHYTSQDCPQCNHRQKKSLSQRTHQCQQCGYTQQRDVAAAINILGKASFAPPESTLVCEGEVKPVDRPTDGEKQERSQERPQDDVLPTLFLTPREDSDPPNGSRKRRRKPKQSNDSDWVQLRLFPESG